MNIYQSCPGRKKLKILLSRELLKSWVSFTEANVSIVSKALVEQGEIDGTILLYMCRVSVLVVWVLNKHHVNHLLFRNNARPSSHASVCLNLIYGRRI